MGWVGEAVIRSGKLITIKNVIILIIFNMIQKADLAGCDLTITYERRTAVDFTMPL